VNDFHINRRQEEGGSGEKKGKQSSGLHVCVTFVYSCSSCNIHDYLKFALRYPLSLFMFGRGRRQSYVNATPFPSSSPAQIYPCTYSYLYVLKGWGHGDWRGGPCISTERNRVFMLCCHAGHTGEFLQCH